MIVTRQTDDPDGERQQLRKSVLAIAAATQRRRKAADATRKALAAQAAAHAKMAAAEEARRQANMYNEHAAQGVRLSRYMQSSCACIGHTRDQVPVRKGVLPASRGTGRPDRQALAALISRSGHATVHRQAWGCTAVASQADADDRWTLACVLSGSTLSAAASPRLLASSHSLLVPEVA